MILAADLHLRDDRPIGRVDDYWAAQEKKFRFILGLAKDYGGELIVAGDFFDKARPSYFLLQWVIRLLQEFNLSLLIVPGQHDLPTHSLHKLPESGVGILQAAGVAEVVRAYSYCGHMGGYDIYGCPFGETPTPPPVFSCLLAWHCLIIRKGEEIWEGQDAPIAGKILRELKEFDIILTGDNHRRFIETFGKRKLINPGSMMRMTIKQMDHRPAVYCVNTDGFIELPIEERVLDDSHVVEVGERDDRIDSFMRSLQTEYELGVSFTNNLRNFLKINKVRQSVVDLIGESLDEVE